LKILRKRTMRIMYLKLLLQLRVLQKKRIWIDSLCCG
jgi:hypothetical protein